MREGAVEEKLTALAYLWQATAHARLLASLSGGLRASIPTSRGTPLPPARDDQLFMPTVYEDVAFGPVNLGLSEEKVKERVNAALAMVNCLHLINRPPHRLSEGQKRSVARATVMAMDPDILIMDEPASNLDPKSRRQLFNLLRGFKHTKIIASHDLDLIQDVCGRCVIIQNGQIAADGPSGEILSNEILLKDNSLELPLARQYQRT